MEEKQELIEQKPKKKVLIITLSVVIALLAIAGIITAFVLNYNVSAPKGLRVLDDGSNVYITVDMNDNYPLYRFTFTSGEEEIVIESEQNTLSIEELEEQGITLGRSYEVTVRYLGENDGSNSEESEPITFTAYKYLDKPVISYDETEDIITWQAVENAEYFMVYYNGANSGGERVDDTFLDMQTLEGGNRSFYVVAVSTNANYRNSAPSNVLAVKVVHRYLPFTSVSFDRETKLVTITGSERLEKLNIYLDGTRYECENFDVSEDEGVYTYSVDISLFYQENMSIGVSPVANGEFNVYDGEILYVA